jgi:hypothetical protein
MQDHYDGVDYGVEKPNGETYTPHLCRRDSTSNLLGGSSLGSSTRTKPETTMPYLDKCYCGWLSVSVPSSLVGLRAGDTDPAYNYLRIP